MTLQDIAVFKKQLQPRRETFSGTPIAELIVLIRDCLVLGVPRGPKPETSQKESRVTNH